MARNFGAQKPRMEGTCMELALEGERLCKAGDCGSGVQFFEAAVQVGTEDLKTLSAIYSQLGNAYFYLQEYGKALEYHKHDLNLARTIGDRLGEAKASGNLGNTLKVLGKFEEAVACCLRHLDISKEIMDKIGEARALYNLGNVHHAKGKHAGRSANQDPGEFPSEVKEALQKATQYYESNLDIVRDLGDRAAQGRACGNLGNTHYLLGNFGEAIKFHEERLAIAKEFGDKSAERRAYSNLGNAHIFLGEFDVAVEYYKRTLQLAHALSDRALEAQACYSLGNTFTLLRDYPTAIDYHLQHLHIAQELSDRVGEGRACWSLGNAHTALGNHERAVQFATKHLEISTEIGDQTGQMTAQMNLSDLRNILCINTDGSNSVAVDGDEADAGPQRGPRVRRMSMEKMEVVKMTPDKLKEKGIPGARPKIQKAATVATDLPHRMLSDKTANAEKALSSDPVDEESFYEMLTRFQGRRIDDQRCSFNSGNAAVLPATRRGENKENSQPKTGASAVQEEFLDMVAGIQGSRMNDQRADLPEFPGLQNSEAVIRPYMTNRKEDLDDQFFEMLMRCQGSRIDEQRTSLPQLSAPTVPDDDFFTLIQRAQSDRLDEQRVPMPTAGCTLPPATIPLPKSHTQQSTSSNKKKKDKKDK